MAIWGMVMASFAVWRLSLLVVEDGNRSGTTQLQGLRAESFLSNRLLDFICWCSVWISAQTAVWVTGGVAAVLLNWLLLSMLSGRLTSFAVVQRDASLSFDRTAHPRTAAPKEDLSCRTVEHAMQANHV